MTELPATDPPAAPQAPLTAVTIDAAAVLFDCDGVLVDSDASVASAWTRWAAVYGLGPEMVGDVVHGRRAADTVALLIDDDRRAAALADINSFEVEDAATVTSIPGAVQLTDEMPDGTWAVVTSGNRILAAARLAAAGVSAPAVVVTADDVTDGKPHPEGYRSAAERLSVDPALAVVLEDADAGVRAARAAGVAAVIGVGERALESDADVVIRDLTWVSWTGDGLLIEPEGILRGPRG
jgi:sugar-phosphatase